jgi:hypothetical protein
MSDACHRSQKLRHRTILLDLLGKCPLGSESFVGSHMRKELTAVFELEMAVRSRFTF